MNTYDLQSCVADSFRNRFQNDLQVCGEIIAYGGLRLSNRSNMNLEGGRIVNGGTPIDPGDLTTKRYVDIACGGLDYKESARVTTVSNISAFKVANKLSIENSLDTVNSNVIVLEIGDRVLVKDQSDQKKNGIYVWDRYNGLIRADDSDGTPNNEVSGGNICFVEEGDINASTGWMIVGKGIKVVNIDNIEWTRIAGPGTGGVSYLNDLLDVTISGTVQNDALVYMSSTNKWQNKSNAASYFQLGAPSDSPYSSDIGITNNDTITNAIRKLDDYIITNTGTGGVTVLDDLSDVVLISLQKNDALIFNDLSDVWENKSYAGTYFEVGNASDGPFSINIGIIYSDTITNAIYKLDNYISNNMVNVSDISELRSDIALITSDIVDIRSDIALITSDLANVISDTAQNTSDIALLGVGGFTSDIAELRSDIALITSDLANVISDTAQNTSDIASLGSGGITETVLVIDNASTPTSILNTAQQGTYILLVKSTLSNGAGALFMATCATNSNVGNVVRIVNAPSFTNEEISMSWPSSSNLQLYHSIVKTGGTGANISYTIKIISA